MWLLIPTLRFKACLVNILWPSDFIWRHRSGATLARVMACCLTVLSYYLNQWWLIINEDFKHSPEGNFAAKAKDNNTWCEFVSLKITNLRSHPLLWGGKKDHHVCYCNDRLLVCVSVFPAIMGSHDSYNLSTYMRKTCRLNLSGAEAEMFKREKSITTMAADVLAPWSGHHRSRDQPWI